MHLPQKTLLFKLLFPASKFSFLYINSIDVLFFCLRSPITYAWHGGIKLSENPEFLSMCMSRDEYEEEGVRGAYDRFDV